MPAVRWKIAREQEAEAADLHGRAMRVQGADPMKTLILLTLLHAGAAGTDAYWTHRNSQLHNFRETDPIARPFVKSTPGCVAFFSVDVGVHFAGAMILHRKHHDWLARGVLAEGIAQNGIGAAYSAHDVGLSPKAP